jgi:hypothetical protein
VLVNLLAQSHASLLAQLSEVLLQDIYVRREQVLRKPVSHTAFSWLTGIAAIRWCRNHTAQWEAFVTGHLKVFDG